MPLLIEPYRAEHEGAVAAFNGRGKANGAPFGLSKTWLAGWLPKRDGAEVFREFFLALDGGEVHGGFTLRRQKFWLRGEVVDAANYQGPLSEGLWDRRYMMAGVQLLRAALREQPLLYALGMGGLEQPLPKQLASAGWALAPVPFRFRVLRGSRFLRNIRPLRRTRARSLIADIAAWSGVGPLALQLVQRLRCKTKPRGEVSRQDEFGAWADTVWDRARGGYAFCAVRDAAALNGTFRGTTDKNLILRARRDGRDIGWALVRLTAMSGDKYFGDLRIGTLVDAMALPGEEAAVVALATRHLREQGADLVVSNQSHVAWLGALGANGYLSGPSNFIFAASPQLAERLGPLAESLPTLHFNRADGDGPIHL
ncbi:MAG: hypothetical protein ABMA13_11805 [Chthoniobacteraceae bacterium]